jgi:endonuclease/exonuclease/phosphatase (EEP) superfamily protein YafD
MIISVVVVALALTNLFHISLPPLIFLGQLTIPAFSLTAGLGFVGAVMRYRWVVGLSALSGCLFAIGLTPWLQSRALVPVRPAPVLKVLYAYAPTDRRPSPLLRNFITRSNPDIILLGEPSFNHTWHDRALIGKGYPYNRQIGRIALFSKTPLDDIRVAFFDERFLSVRLMSTIGPLNLIVARLPRLWPYGETDDYSIELGRLERLSQETKEESTLIIGDFNATLGAPPLLGYVEHTGFKPLTSPIGTWPARAPPYFRLAIDHAFVSPNLTGNSFSVGPEFASDHRPIVVAVQIRTPEKIH